MQISTFNGGLNTRMEPHLLALNEAVEYSDIDSSTGVLKPVNKNTNIGEAVDPYFWYFNSAWLSSATAREYVEYKDKLYWTEASASAKVYDGTNTYQLGITKPASAPSVATGAAGVLTGTYTYVVTFYDDSTGVESQPSVASSSVAPASQQVDLTSIPTSADPQVDKVRIYRLGGTLTQYTLVTTINEGTTTYSDNIADTAVDGHILDSQNYHEAPTGLRYLVEHNGVLFGAVGSKLYFTPIATPYAWGELDFIDYAADITGIGSTPTGLAVFTDLTTYIVTGLTPTDFESNIFDANQGCVEHATIATLKGMLIWLSNDGLCITRGGLVEVISRPKLGKLSVTPLNATVHDDVYYLALADKLIAFDIRFEPLYKEFTGTFSRVGAFNDTLYAVISGYVNTLFTSANPKTMTWKSPELTEGDIAQTKIYKNVYIHISGQLTLEIFIDGLSVKYTNLNGKGVKDINIPQPAERGSTIQFRITGAGQVNSIEYKVLGRQNGR